MTRAQRKDIIEIVGLIAIVASLIFLSLEVRQNTTAQNAGAYQNRSDALQELSMRIAESEVLARIHAHVQTRPEHCPEDEVFCGEINHEFIRTLSPTEFQQYRSFLTAHAFRLQNMTVQYQFGLLSDEYHRSGVVGAINAFMPRWEAFDVPQGVNLRNYVAGHGVSN